jgi:phenylacetate-coenzyme A ligase PaaK-like adenylate-forming protein
VLSATKLPIPMVGRLENMPDENKLMELVQDFGDDLELMAFYICWIKNGMKASLAYKELHPKVSVGSSEVLGHRWLRRVKEKIGAEAIANLYGLDIDLYMEQLRDGNKAMKRDQFSGEMYPDHTTRLKYHDKLGKLLGLEVDTPTTQIAIKGEEMSIQFIAE